MKKSTLHKITIFLSFIIMIVMNQNCGRGFKTAPLANLGSSSGGNNTPPGGDQTPPGDGQTPPGSFQFIKGYATLTPMSMATPALNVPFVDTVYGTTVTRVTDPSQITDHGSPSFVRHEYSRRPAFNKDSTKMLQYMSGGYYALYNVDKANNKASFVKTITDTNTVTDNMEPNWSATDPNSFYHFGNRAAGFKIYKYDTLTDSNTVVVDLETRVKALYPNAENMWTKGEGRPSNDGKIWCMMLTKYESSTQKNYYYGFIAYNMETDKIIGHVLSLDGDMPDHISTSPLGNYCVPSWDWSGGKGTRAYGINRNATSDTLLTTFTQLNEGTEHSDLAVTKDGKEVYVSFYYWHSNYPSQYSQNDGFVYKVDLATGQRTNLFRVYGDNATAAGGHISGVSKDKPGYVVVSFEGCGSNYGHEECDPTIRWFYKKMVIVDLNPRTSLYACQSGLTDCDPEIIYNVASNHYSDEGYYSETQAVANNDLTKILFVSAWGATNGTSSVDVRDYMVDIPVGSLP